MRWAWPILSTLAAHMTTSHLESLGHAPSHLDTVTAAVSGYRAAFIAGAALMALGAVLLALTDQFPGGAGRPGRCADPHRWVSGATGCGSRCAASTGRRAGMSASPTARSKPRGWSSAVVTLALTLIGGVAIRIIDPSNIHSIGDGLWWSIQTVTTVGYGDIVPKTAGGRLVGVAVMITGIAFMTVTTAAVTNLFIEAARKRRADDAGPSSDEIARLHERIDTLIDEVRSLRDDREAGTRGPDPGTPGAVRRAPSYRVGAGGGDRRRSSRPERHERHRQQGDRHD